MIKVIIPAAGESRRFSKKGIKTPKPLIKFRWGNSEKKTMLEHAMTGIVHQPILVGLKALPSEEINYGVIQISSSLGQAHTVAQIVQRLKLDTSILILNSDSMFKYPLMTFIQQVQDFKGGAIVFNGEYNPIYSYIDHYPLFERTAEKEPLSPWAMAGAFYFKSKNDFLLAYEKYHSANNGREEYISEVYNYLPGQKLAVFIPREQWICWGTAEELLADENISDLEF
jgi:NDP-sugar pyrophosphorylase family protein